MLVFAWFRNLGVWRPLHYNSLAAQNGKATSQQFKKATMHNAPQQSIMFGQRVAGVGTMFVGLFALYYSLMFIQSLWDTPSRNLGIGVTLGSVVMMVMGIFIGFPDKLPKHAAALSMIMFGLCSVLCGSIILVWIVYNTFVERQLSFVAGPPGFAGIMIAVGIGLVVKGFRFSSSRVKP